MDIYYTIEKPGESKYVEKMSRFLGFALPVHSAEEARMLIKEYQNEYHDSRHVCWAYMLGSERTEWQLNDNGEPSGTAGKPILGQINSRGLTDVLVVVVRYFGGIKLGTPGLIAAYRAAAAEALEDAGIKEMHRMEVLHLEYGYERMDRVMRIIKRPDVEIIKKEFDNLCRVEIRLRASIEGEIKGRLESEGGIRVEKAE